MENLFESLWDFQNFKNNLLNVQDVLFEGQSHFRYYLQNDYFPFKFQSTTLRPLPLIWNYLRSVEYELNWSARLVFGIDFSKVNEFYGRKS